MHFVADGANRPSFEGTISRALESVDFSTLSPKGLREGAEGFDLRLAWVEAGRHIELYVGCSQAYGLGEDRSSYAARLSVPEGNVHFSPEGSKKIYESMSKIQQEFELAVFRVMEEKLAACVRSPGDINSGWRLGITSEGTLIQKKDGDFLISVGDASREFAGIRVPEVKAACFSLHTGSTVSRILGPYEAPELIALLNNLSKS